MVDIIVIGELLVEVMRERVGIPHTAIGEIYRAPYPSGAPGIFASSAARMTEGTELSVGYIGVVGKDDFGRVILDKLLRDGIEISQIRSSDNHTGAAFVQYNEDKSRKFIFMGGAARETCEDDVNPEYFKNVKALHIMGSALSISLSSRKAAYKAIKTALQANPDVEISFDPNLRPEMMDINIIKEIIKPVMEVATIIFPSGEEAEMLAGPGESDEYNICQRIFSMALRCKHIIFKKGENGASAYGREKSKSEVVTEDGFEVEEIDATGAGDSFGGAFMIEYLSGKPIKHCLTFANAVGALKVTQFGPMTEHSREEVEKFIVTNRN